MNSYPDELAHFAKDGTTWWDLEGPFKPLHQINPVRLAYIESQIPLKDKTVVDIGCGGGILAEAMAKSGARITGIDLVPESLETAKAHAMLMQQEDGAPPHYECISAEDYAKQAPSQADLVTCLELLEHVPEPQSILEAAAAMVKPGGKVICSTLNRHPKAFVFGIVAAEYVLGIVPKGTHHYRQFIKPSELNRMAASVGLQSIDVQGIQFDPWRGQARLDNNLSINYIMTFERTR